MTFYSKYDFPEHDVNNDKPNIVVDNDAIINYSVLDRDLLKKFNKYAIEYIGGKDENGLPLYQDGIYKKPEIHEILVGNPTQTHILGSQVDVDKFKEFVG